jgi:hypothetical protein
LAAPEPFAVRDRDVTHAVLLLFGGDNDLSPWVEEDLAEMAAGNRGPFAVLALADYADEGAAVIEWTPRTGRHEVECWGEIDTGDPETLARFVARALVTYPPETALALGFWDHGSGVFGEDDPKERLLARAQGRPVGPARGRRQRARPARRLFLGARHRAAAVRSRAMLHDDTNQGVLTNIEASRMLAAAFARAGRGRKVELLFSDTCLNGMVEVLEELSPFAEVITASPELEPGDGWEYREWLARMSDAPPAGGEAWGRLAVEAFEAGYRDRPDEHPCTLAAFRTENEIARAFAAFVAAARSLGRAGFERLRAALGRAQTFARDLDSYDLEDFMRRLRRQPGAPGLRAAAAGVVEAVRAARVANVALGPSVRRSTGLAFWFPSSRRAFEATAPSYSRLAFARRTGWAEYLAETWR